jgi:peptidoglycan/LPS O-acetylase OafA/YrhL
MEINKTIHPAQNRLFNLDYLQGMAALGIMVYHYLSWTLGKFSSDTFLGRFGVYGVSIFYILSGLTLYYVYYDKMKPTTADLLTFFKKRFFRIFPLLWLVTLTAISLSGKMPDLFNLFLNLSGLFGFVKWDTYFSAGVWSIGNELVFYVFFPFFVLFTKRHRLLMILLSLVLLSLYLYFAFHKLPHSSVSDQWRNYINPLNQVFLFLSGFLLGLFFRDRHFGNSVTISLLIFAIFLFIFYPVSGEQINVKIGLNRVVFTVCCFIFCLSFYKLNVQFPKVIHRPLTQLGEVSYSVYLLHPII